MSTRTSKLFLVALVGGLIVAALAAGAVWHEQVGAWLGLGHGEETHPEHGTAAPGGQLWTCGMHPQVLQTEPGLCPICHMKLTPVAPDAMGGGGAAASGERKIAYWWDPMMSPPYISQGPGKSPMGMDLVPVYEDEVKSGAAVAIDPVVVQNMGVRTMAVKEGPLATTLRSVGVLRAPEPLLRDVTLKVQGWIEKLHADTEGMFLEKGAPLFEVYSPDLLIAEEELVAARLARDRVKEGAAETLVRSADQLLETARRKLALWDVAEDDVVAIERERKVRRTLLYRSPIAGFLVEKDVVQGAAVEPGMRLLRISDQSTLWLDLQVYEDQLPSLALRQSVTATVKGFPGRAFQGVISRILPRTDASSRTVTVRVELENPELALKPGMYAIAESPVELASRAVLVPREAVIDTGVRQVAFLAKGGGRFEPREVRLGAESTEGLVQVLEGLAPGEVVVTSGQFLLDVESRMREAIQKMLDERLAKPAAPAAAGGHAGHAVAAGEEANGGSKAPAAKPAEIVPAETRAQVDALVDAYLDLARSLAADRAEDAAQAAGALHERAAPAAEGPDHAAHLIAGVRAAAAKMIDRPIAEQREAFKAVSEAVVALADHVKPEDPDRLYVLHCSMAPGSWLQTDETVANPYYGKAMLRCGEVTRTIMAAARR